MSATFFALIRARAFTPSWHASPSIVGINYWGMRKRLITPTPQAGTPRDEGWLDLDRAATVEVTSEEKDYDIESALVAGETQGWRAANSGLKRSGCSSITRKGSVASRSFSRKPRHRVPKSSSCDGLQMADARFEKLCASSGISVLLTQSARSRNIRLGYPMSPCLNWSSCPTSVEDRLAPRSRVCVCLDPPRGARLTRSGRPHPEKHSEIKASRNRTRLCWGLRTTHAALVAAILWVVELCRLNVRTTGALSVSGDSISVILGYVRGDTAPRPPWCSKS